MARERCPQDGTPLEIVAVYSGTHAEARCPSCGGRYQVHGQFKPQDAVAAPSTVRGNRRLLERCPYDQGGLILVHRMSYAQMARFKCTTANCLFEIVQGDAG